MGLKENLSDPVDFGHVKESVSVLTKDKLWLQTSYVLFLDRSSLDGLSFKDPNYSLISVTQPSHCLLSDFKMLEDLSTTPTPA